MKKLFKVSHLAKLHESFDWVPLNPNHDFQKFKLIPSRALNCLTLNTKPISVWTLISKRKNDEKSWRKYSIMVWKRRVIIIYNYFSSESESERYLTDIYMTWTKTGSGGGWFFCVVRNLCPKKPPNPQLEPIFVLFVTRHSSGLLTT